MKLYTIIDEDGDLVNSTHIETERGGRQLGEAVSPFFFFQNEDAAKSLAKTWEEFDRLNVDRDIKYTVIGVEVPGVRSWECRK